MALRKKHELFQSIVPPQYGPIFKVTYSIAAAMALLLRIRVGEVLLTGYNPWEIVTCRPGQPHKKTLYGGLAPDVTGAVSSSGNDNPDERRRIATSFIKGNLGTGAQTKWCVPLRQGLSKSIAKRSARH